MNQYAEASLKELEYIIRHRNDDTWKDISQQIMNAKDRLQFIPKRFLYILENKHFNHMGKQLKSTYLLDIMHTFMIRYYIRNENKLNTSAIILREKYGVLYHYYIDYLISNHFIVLVKDYKKGKNARVYALHESITEGEITRVRNNDRILLKKIKKNLLHINELQVDRDVIDPVVKTKLEYDLYHVEIDKEHAEEYLSVIKIDNRKYNLNMYSVTAISEKDIFKSYDGYGRMHTNYTNLKSYIRKNCLTIDNEPVAEIDIANSQPLFLTKLIWNEYKDIINPDEFNNFCYLTKKGLFYQYVLDRTGLIDKSQCKEMIYKVFFGTNNGKAKYNKMFAKLFPSIYMAIKIYKKDNNNYKSLSHKLQRMESEFMFNDVIRELIETYDDIRIITIHDSIICQSRFKNLVEFVLHEKMKNYFKYD